MVKGIATKGEFDALLKESGDKLVVVDFYADWCGPCRMMAPKIESMAGEHPNVVFVKVNVDDNAETAEDCNISAMPTFKLYKNGTEVGEVVGANEEKLRALITANA